MTYKTPKLVVSRRPGFLHDLGQWAERDLVKLPFKSVLSLEPLVEFWQHAGREEGMVGSRLLYERIRSELKQHPELAGPIEDPAILQDGKDLLDLLMMPVFPPALRDNDISAATTPFDLQAFYATPAFDHFLAEDDGIISGKVNLDLRTYTYGKIITAYLHILRTVYGVDVPFEFPLLFTSEDPETGLDRYYKLESDLRFLKIKQTKELPKLTREMQRRLLTNLSDLDAWMRVIPPDTFEFYGFDIIHAADVTDVEIVSLLERDLLEGEALVTSAALPVLRDRIRVLLGQRDINLGMAAFEGNRLFLLHKPLEECPDTLFRRSSQYDLSVLSGSVMGKAIRLRAMQTIDDLAHYVGRTSLEDEMLEAGARSVIAAPLFFQGNAVGVLYLWSERPGALSTLNVLSLLDVLPLFSAAVKRGSEELQNRVQSVILSKYTAIHSSVEWRFRKAALNYLQAKELGREAEVEPIVFHHVFPLYAATDIRRSSTHRIEALRADLVDHLREADEVLRYVRSRKQIPILDYLLARTDQYKSSLRGELSSGDEANIRDFLVHEIEPVLRHFRTEAGVRERIEQYYDALDPEKGLVYRRAKEFDESVTTINRVVSQYLDQEEHKAQQAFPHYFERHQTDGVDFTIYVGSSLMENGDFDELYVKNLRLWQLMVMCGVARRIEPLKHQLKVPLEATHLILTQSTPISIRFRFDETRFDVDGTHHVRYQIMKQRTEKALIKGTDERLVQPGKIAIVYSQAREAWEYSDYIRFLQQMGYLTDEVEDLELGYLQGMMGLRALRVTVKPESPSGQERVDERTERVRRVRAKELTQAPDRG